MCAADRDNNSNSLRMNISLSTLDYVSLLFLLLFIQFTDRDVAVDISEAFKQKSGIKKNVPFADILLYKGTEDHLVSAV